MWDPVSRGSTTRVSQRLGILASPKEITKHYITHITHDWLDLPLMAIDPCPPQGNQNFRGGVNIPKMGSNFVPTPTNIYCDNGVQVFIPY